MPGEGTQPVREVAVTEKSNSGSGGSDWTARFLAVVAFIGSTWIGACVQRREAVRAAQWEAKRHACLEALDVIDAYFTTQGWETDGKPRPVQGVQKLNIRQIRRVFNELAVSVGTSDVLVLYGKAFNLETVPGRGSPERVSLGLIAELRNAIRRELFDAPPIDQRDLAWIFNVKTACTDDDAGCPAVETGGPHVQSNDSQVR